VYDVLGMLAAGMSHSEILADFPYLTEEDINQNGVTLRPPIKGRIPPITAAPVALCQWNPLERQKLSIPLIKGIATLVQSRFDYSFFLFALTVREVVSSQLVDVTAKPSRIDDVLPDFKDSVLAKTSK
jgi:hypothetical protein